MSEGPEIRTTKLPNGEWEAIDDNTHDLGGPRGFGRTEEEAVAELIEVLKEGRYYSFDMAGNIMT